MSRREGRLGCGCPRAGVLCSQGSLVLNLSFTLLCRRHYAIHGCIVTNSGVACVGLQGAAPLGPACPGDAAAATGAAAARAGLGTCTVLGFAGVEQLLGCSHQPPSIAVPVLRHTTCSRCCPSSSCRVRSICGSTTCAAHHTCCCSCCSGLIGKGVRHKQGPGGHAVHADRGSHSGLCSQRHHSHPVNSAGTVLRCRRTSIALSMDEDSSLRWGSR
mmetsp:Transcript_5430/g.13409  ORF Transcript_5430/g.13409 Transcript_5430/m.13409 type:complete len:216 (+) Transcript_5430:98-745(+)